jgi:hypothetical protein
MQGVSMVRQSLFLIALAAITINAGTTATNCVTKSAPVKTTAAIVKPPACDSLIVTARLIEVAGKFPPNDLYNYVYIMKYRIIAIEKGAYDGPEIFIGHYNPLIQRNAIKDKMDPFVAGDVPAFEVGATHRLVLIKPIDKVWKDAVQDEYFDSELDKYFAVRADIVKK